MKKLKVPKYANGGTVTSGGDPLKIAIDAHNAKPDKDWQTEYYNYTRSLKPTANSRIGSTDPSFTPEDEQRYSGYQQTLPENLRDHPDSHADGRYYWYHQGKPNTFKEALTPNENREHPMYDLVDHGQEGKFYHGYSIEPNTMRWNKAVDHNTSWMEYREYMHPQHGGAVTGYTLQLSDDPRYLQYKKVNTGMEQKQYRTGTKKLIVPKYLDGVQKVEVPPSADTSYDSVTNATVGGAVNAGASGAQVGSMFGPVGTLVGGGVGAIAGGVAGLVGGLHGREMRINEQNDMRNSAMAYNKAVDQQGRYEGDQAFQSRRMLTSTDYMNPQPYATARNGMKIRRQKPIEVEGNELIFDKDHDGVYKLVADMAGGPTHEQGGIPIMGTEGQVVIPAKDRHEILNIVDRRTGKVTDPHQFEVERRELPNDSPEGTAAGGLNIGGIGAGFNALGAISNAYGQGLTGDWRTTHQSQQWQNTGNVLTGIGTGGAMLAEGIQNTVQGIQRNKDQKGYDLAHSGDANVYNGGAKTPNLTNYKQVGSTTTPAQSAHSSQSQQSTQVMQNGVLNPAAFNVPAQQPTNMAPNFGAMPNEELPMDTTGLTSDNQLMGYSPSGLNQLRNGTARLKVPVYRKGGTISGDPPNTQRNSATSNDGRQHINQQQDASTTTTTRTRTTTIPGSNPDNVRAGNQTNDPNAWARGRDAFARKYGVPGSAEYQHAHNYYTNNSTGPQGYVPASNRTTTSTDGEVTPIAQAQAGSQSQSTASAEIAPQTHNTYFQIPDEVNRTYQRAANANAENKYKPNDSYLPDFAVGTALTYPIMESPQPPEVRRSNMVDPEYLHYVDRSDPQRAASVMASRVADDRSRNASGGNVQNYTANANINSFMGADRLNQINTREAGTANDIANHNVGIANQAEYANTEISNNDMTINEQNRQAARDITGRNQYRLSNWLNNTNQNFQTMRHDQRLDSENQRRNTMMQGYYDATISETERQARAREEFDRGMLGVHLANNPEAAGALGIDPTQYSPAVLKALGYNPSTTTTATSTTTGNNNPTTTIPVGVAAPNNQTQQNGYTGPWSEGYSPTIQPQQPNPATETQYSANDNNLGNQQNIDPMTGRPLYKQGVKKLRAISYGS